MLIFPTQVQVSGAGYAIATVGHTLSGLTWKVYQIGCGLGQLSLPAQVAAHVNGVPLAATVSMQQSVFANLPGQAPYAMETFFVGPPYIVLSSGDQIVVGVINATPGDLFTVAAYVEEADARANLSMGS